MMAMMLTSMDCFCYWFNNFVTNIELLIEKPFTYIVMLNNGEEIKPGESSVL